MPREFERQFEREFEHSHPHEPHYHPPHHPHWDDDDDNWATNLIIGFLSLFS